MWLDLTEDDLHLEIGDYIYHCNCGEAKITEKYTSNRYTCITVQYVNKSILPQSGWTLGYKSDPLCGYFPKYKKANPLHRIWRALKEDKELSSRLLEGL